MAYPFLLMMLILLYVRPGDLNPALASWPFMGISTAGIGTSLLTGWGAGAFRPRWAPHLTWLIGTWLAIIFSQVSHTYLAMTVRAFTEFFLNVFIAFAMVCILNSRSRLKGFATIWIWAAVFLAVGGIYQSMTGVGFGGQPLVKGRIQGVGIFSDPNDLALTFLIAVPLARARYGTSGPIGRILFFLLAALFTYATFLTNSRGGMLALLLCFFLLSARRFGLFLGSVIGGAIVLFLLAVGPSRMNEIDSKEESAQGRIAAWSQGLQMFKQNPAVGVGYGMFTNYHELTAHNSFVLSFAETGLIGAYFWTGLIYISILGLRRLGLAAGVAPPDPWLLSWTKDTTIAFAVFLTGIFFLSRTYNVLLYLLVGFAASLWRVGVEERPSAAFSVSWKDRRRIFVIVVAGVITTYFLVKGLSHWSSKLY